MKNEEQKLLVKTIRVAKTLGLKHIRISPGLIAGSTEDRMVLLFHPTEVEFSFGSAGISQIGDLHNILDMFDGPIAIDVETSVDADGNNHAKRASMTAGKVKVGYRFSHPAVVQAPKKVAETVWITIPKLPAEITSYIDKAIRAMQAESVILQIIDDKLIITAKDLHGEAVTIDTEVVLTDVDGASIPDSKFEFRKDVAKIIAHSLEHAGLSISRRGFMFCTYEGLTVLLPPFVKDE